MRHLSRKQYLRMWRRVKKGYDALTTGTGIQNRISLCLGSGWYWNPQDRCYTYYNRCYVNGLNALGAGNLYGFWLRTKHISPREAVRSIKQDARDHGFDYAVKMLVGLAAMKESEIAGSGLTGMKPWLEKQMTPEALRYG